MQKAIALFLIALGFGIAGMWRLYSRILEASDAAEGSEELTGVEDEVEAILATRGYKYMRRPTEPPDLERTLCTASLTPGPARSVEAAEEELAVFFKDSSGFWTGSGEAATINAAATDSDSPGGGGPAAYCKEATYGEITVLGLNMVLQRLAGEANAVRPSDVVRYDQAMPFDAVVDLGAGVGRTAAAAALLGFAPQAFGVELGPQRFAMGCTALDKQKRPTEDNGSPQLSLMRGDARLWAKLLLDETGVKCGPRWAFYLGAKCFRDNLLGAVAEAIAAACPPGTLVAVLGRRTDAWRASDDSGMSYKQLDGGKPLNVPTTWNRGDGSEVFLYVLEETS